MIKTNLHPLVKEVLIDRKQIQARSKELAQEISNFYRHQKVKDNTLVIVALLKGAVPFLAELINHFDYEIEMDYMVVSSYFGGAKGNLKPKIMVDMVSNIQGKHVLVVDDIVDSGKSLALVKKHLLAKGAKEVRFATLIDKPTHRQSDVKVDWVGFTLGDVFLIGFGLDYEERLRNLPYIAATDMDKLKNWKW